MLQIYKGIPLPLVIDLLQSLSYFLLQHMFNTGVFVSFIECAKI